MANLTDKQYLELAKLSYIYEGALEKWQDKAVPRPTLGTIADELLLDEGIPLVAPGKTENGFLSDGDFRDTLRFIQNDPLLSKLTLLEYFNDNASSGFVGMALRDGADDRYFVFTGSEGPMFPLPGKDWLDNYYYGLTGESPQFDVALEFTKRHMKQGKKHYFTAHSKGGLNAMHVVVQLGDYDVTGVMFNAPGHNRILHLNPSEERFLFENVKNYVTYSDIVGNLFPYSENMIVVDMLDDFEMGGKSITKHGPFERFFRGHFFPGFKFDDHGNVIPNPNRTLQALGFSKVTLSKEFTLFDLYSRIELSLGRLAVGTAFEVFEYARKKRAMERGLSTASYEALRKALTGLRDSYADMANERLKYAHKVLSLETGFRMDVYESIWKGLTQYFNLSVEMMIEVFEHARKGKGIDWNLCASVFQSHLNAWTLLFNFTAEIVNVVLEYERTKQAINWDHYVAALGTHGRVMTLFYEYSAERADVINEYAGNQFMIIGDLFAEVYGLFSKELTPFIVIPAMEAKEYLDSVIDTFSEWYRKPALTPAPGPAPDATPKPEPKRTPEPTPKATPESAPKAASTPMPPTPTAIAKPTPNPTPTPTPNRFPPTATPKPTPAPTSPRKPPSTPTATTGPNPVPAPGPRPTPKATPAPPETLDTDPFADIAAAGLDPSDPEDFAELAKRFNHGMSLSVVKALIELDAEILDNPIKIEEKMDVPATYNTPAHRLSRTTYVNPADRSVTSTPWTVV